MEDVTWRPSPPESETAGEGEAPTAQPEEAAPPAREPAAVEVTEPPVSALRRMVRPLKALASGSKRDGSLVPVQEAPAAAAEESSPQAPLPEVQPAPPPKKDFIPGLSDADLVIAESLKVGQVAWSSKVPAHRIWILVVPAQRLHAGAHGTIAEEIGRIAKRFGGMLTDSEPARESIERAVPDRRPRVEVFPPLALDRRCPECGPLKLAADRSTTEVNPVVAQLEYWRTLVDQVRVDAPPNLPYSYAAVRFREISGPWAQTERRTWEGELAEPTRLGPEGSPRDGWTADAQDRAARAVLDAVLPAATDRARRSVLLAGNDLKFAVDLAECLDHRGDITMSVDEWPVISHGGDRTEQLAAKAQSIFAEWARPSAVWYSRNKRPDQLLVVRLHRFELDAPYPRDLVVGNVDAMVYIAPLFGRRIRDELSWPVDKLAYIPNYLDVDWLDRPKLHDARFGLGFVGIEWSRKRFDLALDLLSAVRAEDPRFCLFVRSVMPWNNRTVWSIPEEREFAGWCFERIEQDPLLRGAVVFDAPGRDMARWYRRVGHILSTSDEEGVHTSVAEGMASGAVPVIRPWPGADEIYGKEWIHHAVGDAVTALLDGADEAQWTHRAARARTEIRRSHDPRKVVSAWADLLHGDVDGARRYFAEYSAL